MKDTCHNSVPKICAQLMLAIYITYGKRLTQFLAHSRNIIHECHPTPAPHTHFFLGPHEVVGVAAQLPSPSM